MTTQPRLNYDNVYDKALEEIASSSSTLLLIEACLGDGNWELVDCAGIDLTSEVVAFLSKACEEAEQHFANTQAMGSFVYKGLRPSLWMFNQDDQKQFRSIKQQTGQPVSLVAEGAERPQMEECPIEPELTEMVFALRHKDGATKPTIYVYWRGSSSEPVFTTAIPLSYLREVLALQSQLAFDFEGAPQLPASMFFRNQELPLAV